MTAARAAPLLKARADCRVDRHFSAAAAEFKRDGRTRPARNEACFVRKTEEYPGFGQQKSRIAKIRLS